VDTTITSSHHSHITLVPTRPTTTKVFNLSVNFFRCRASHQHGATKHADNIRRDGLSLYKAARYSGKTVVLVGLMSVSFTVSTRKVYA